MNVYEIENIVYRATNEYTAVKAAYKMAQKILFVCYLGSDTWCYIAQFPHGKATVLVKKVK